MTQAKVTIEFTGRMEIPVQGWNDETNLKQVKKQAAEETSNWRIYVRAGQGEYIPMDQIISFRVTEVIVPTV